MVAIYLPLCLYRYQDEAFITWNNSEQQFYTLLETAKTQFPQEIWNMTSIGTNIHYLDLLLGHNNGILQTSVYYYPNFGTHSFPTTPDLTEHLMENKEKSLRAALLRAVRYCSDNDIFEDERLHMEITFKDDNIDHDDNLFEQVYDRFLEDFGVVLFRSLYHRSGYDIFRQHVFTYDKYNAKLKQEYRDKNKIAFYLPYTPYWNTKAMTKFEYQFNRLLTEYFGDHSKVKNQWVKVLRCHSHPLTANDLLVDKRPPIDLLTLPYNGSCLTNS